MKPEVPGPHKKVHLGGAVEALDPESDARFDAFVDELVVALQRSGWSGSQSALCGYCSGLLVPGERKSMEPIAARLDPGHTQACYASIQRLITDSEWDAQVVLDVSRAYALPWLTARGRIEAWIADDTSFPKQGRHSVGVAHQYCGCRGNHQNCQVAVSLSLANHFAALPVAYRLYLPESWTRNPLRCQKAGVPGEVVFKRKWEIALDLVDLLLAKGVARAPFLADAGYGHIPAFRRGLTERGFRYVLGIQSNERVWPPGWSPLPPRTKHPGRRRAKNHLTQNPDIPAMTVEALAMALPPEAWRKVAWGLGTRGILTSRFAWTRVRPTQGYCNRRSRAVYAIPDEEWLLMEWSEGKPEPTRYWLSTLAPDTPIADLVDQAKLRWRIEQDYEELKQEIGLGHFEGRTWRGFHHHACLSVACHAFLLAERARLSPPRFRFSRRLPEPALPPSRPWRRPSPAK